MTEPVAPSPTPGSAPRPRARRAARPFVWVTTTYFAEGFPYNMVNTVAEAMFKEFGASLQAIGLTSIFHVPWNLKFLWAPAIDVYETKLRFIVGLEVVLAGILFGLAALASAHTQTHVLVIASLLFMAMGCVAATHDIAIDGYYLEALDHRERETFVGYRAAAWRVASVASGGGILVLAERLGWSVAWWTAGGLMLGLAAFHATALPRVERRRRPLWQMFATGLRRALVGVTLATLGFTAVWGLVSPTSFFAAASIVSDAATRWVLPVLGIAVLVALAIVRLRWRQLSRSEHPYARAFVDFLEQPQAARILAFIVLFRVGESFLLKMRYPFLRDEVEMTQEFFGLAIVGVGSVATIIGVLAGGHAITRWGFERCLWPFVLAQNALNLLYMGVAMLPDPAAIGSWVVAGILMVEHIGAGLGTAVLLVYIMRCCDPRHRATHMAIMTALMSIGFSVAGLLSGYLAHALGYTIYFGFTFLATFPAMALMIGLPHRGDADAAPSATDTEIDDPRHPSA